MSIKSAQAKQQLRNSDGTFANENKKAGLPSNDMIQRASKLLAKSSATVDEPIIKPSVKSEGYMGSTAITGGKYDASRSPAENAKLMRADIKALQKNGQLPKDWKIGVRTSTGSASWRARFTIQLPEGESSTYVPTHATTRNSASRSATSTRIRTTTPWSTTSTRTDTSPCKP